MDAQALPDRREGGPATPRGGVRAVCASAWAGMTALACRRANDDLLTLIAVAPAGDDRPRLRV